MCSRRAPPDSLSASDSAETDDPASAATSTSTRRGVLRLLGANAVAGVAGCLDGDEGRTDDDFPEGVRPEDGWWTYAHGDANTVFLHDGTIIFKPIIKYEPDFRISSTEPAVADGVAYMSSDPIRALDPAIGEELWIAQGGEWTAPIVLGRIVYSFDVTIHGPN